MSKDEIRLRVGNRVLAMRFKPARYTAVFRDYFAQPYCSDTPDLVLDFKIVRRRTAPAVENSLFNSKVLTDRGFRMGQGLVEGRFNRNTHIGKIRVDRELAVVPTIRVFEQLLYQAFYSAESSAGRNAILIHSSAVSRSGSGYLFVGRPESGKSTIADLSLPNTVFNDEINLLYLSGEKILVGSTPFNGLYKDKSEGCCDLKAVFLLKKGRSHKLTRPSGAEAVRSIMQEIVPPIGLDEVVTQDVRAGMLELASGIQRRVPVYRLEFRKDRGFWQLIDQELNRKRGSL